MSYADEVLADGASWYWPLDEASAPVTDLVGGIQLTQQTFSGAVITFGVELVPDLPGGVSFNTNAMLQGGSAVGRINNDELTLECFVRRNTNFNDAEAIFAKGNEWHVGFIADGYLALRTLSGLGVIAQSAEPLDGEVHHIAITKNGSTRHIYVDGEPGTLLGPNSVVASGASSLRIGAHSASPPPQYSRAAMGHVAIYQTALTQQQIIAHYEAAFPTAPPPPEEPEEPKIYLPTTPTAPTPLAPKPINPHFDLPFRFLKGNGVAVAEQDSYEDVCNCVEAIIRCPQGWRVDNIDFGFPDPVLLNQPVITEEVMETVGDQEPRAQLVWSEAPDTIDLLIDRIRVDILPNQVEGAG